MPDLKNKFSFLLFSFLFLMPKSYSQRGMPPKETYTASIATVYPQHEDFKESMLSRL